MGFLDQFKSKSTAKVVPLRPVPKKKKPAFKMEWVKLPMQWVEVLQGSSGTTYQLAIMILIESFKQSRMGREVVLTSQTTGGMCRNTKLKAVNEMVKLGLIEAERNGRQAIRVKLLNH